MGRNNWTTPNLETPTQCSKSQTSNSEKPYVHRMIAVALEIDGQLSRIEGAVQPYDGESTYSYLKRIREKVPSIPINVVHRIAFLQESARFRQEKFDVEQVMELRSLLNQFLKILSAEYDSLADEPDISAPRGVIATFYQFGQKIMPNNSGSKRRRNKFGGSDGWPSVFIMTTRSYIGRTPLRLQRPPTPKLLDPIGLKIIQQLEYYFGDDNLSRDTFLQQQIKEDDGWVPIETMLKFKRLAAISNATGKIAEAVLASGSEIIAVSEDNSKIRRNAENPLPENSLEYWQEIKDRTVYMKGFPAETLLADIISWANKFGETESVLNKFGYDDVPRSVFITYKSGEEAKTAQKSTDTFNEFALSKYMENDYWSVKNKESEKAVNQSDKGLPTCSQIVTVV